MELIDRPTDGPKLDTYLGEKGQIIDYRSVGSRQQQIAMHTADYEGLGIQAEHEQKRDKFDARFAFYLKLIMDKYI